MNRLRRDGKPHASESNAPEAPSHTRQIIRIGDVLERLAEIESASVQLVVCDPPYNLELADWDRYDDYLAWASGWLEECLRVLHPNGSLIVFGGLQYQGAKGGDLLELMHYIRHRTSLRLVNLIVWNYSNGMSAHRFFANRHEEIVWFAKSKNYVFNLDAVREPYDAATLASYSRDRRLRPSTLAMGRNPTNVWRIGRLNANAVERTGHPTQKPRALISRLVLALSRPGDWVLDPFAGSGVTTRTCIELGRNGIAIDRDPRLKTYLAMQLQNLPQSVVPFTIESAFDAAP
jgi:site-specific DNA-methyltransferase (adenine-specific)